jgi:hypothetical protein
MEEKTLFYLGWCGKGGQDTVGHFHLGWCFSMDPVVFKVTVSRGIFCPPLQLGLEPAIYTSEALDKA